MLVMRARLVALIGAVALCVVACGGGSEVSGADGASARLTSAAVAGPREGASARALMAPSRQQASPAALASLDAEALMDWAELTYPALFPSFQQNRTTGPYTYRFYPENGAILAVKSDGTIYVLGAAFGDRLIAVGQLSQFTCNVFPESCATANAGEAQSVVVGSTVVLNGSASSSPTGTMTFSWSLVSRPARSVAALAGASNARPTFVADVEGEYLASLTVADALGVSAASTVRVTASIANAAPVARAGSAQSVVPGAIVLLNGAASSDANGDALTYAWSLTGKPAGSTATLSGATNVAPSFKADLAGTYMVSLVVNDGRLSSAASTVSVVAAPLTPVVSNTPTSSGCCRTCSTGKACGDSCISRTLTCHKSGGCAC